MPLYTKKSRQKFCCFNKNTYFCNAFEKKLGAVAQLNRASDYGSEGLGFESLQRHQSKKHSSVWKRPNIRPFFLYPALSYRRAHPDNRTISQIRFRSCEENKAEKIVNKNRALRKKIVFYTVKIFPQIIQITRHIIENMSEIF